MNLIKQRKILFGLFVILANISPVHAMYYHVLHVETGEDSGDEQEIEVEKEPIIEEEKAPNSSPERMLAPMINLLENEILLHVPKKSKLKSAVRRVGYIRGKLQKIARIVEKEIGSDYRIDFSFEDDVYKSANNLLIRPEITNLPEIKCLVRITLKADSNSIVPNEVLAHAFLKFYGKNLKVGFGYNHCWWEESNSGKRVLEALAWQNHLSDELAHSYVQTRAEMNALYGSMEAK